MEGVIDTCRARLNHPRFGLVEVGCVIHLGPVHAMRGVAYHTRGMIFAVALYIM